MNNDNRSIYERQFDPLVQAGVVLAAVFLIDVIGAAVGGSGPEGRPNLFAWQCAAAFILFFALFNSIFMATTKEVQRYFQRSMYGFSGLVLGGGLLAYLFSGVGVRDAGSYFWILIVLTIGYFVFMGMVITIRRVVDFAQREEWNQPRKKHRGKK
ncbi:MAG: hypothetical protein AAGF87_12095 [Bacteroidota bacterium]